MMRSFMVVDSLGSCPNSAEMPPFADFLPTVFRTEAGQESRLIDAKEGGYFVVRYRRREILDRLQHSFGKEMVKKISFRVG